MIFFPEDPGQVKSNFFFLVNSAALLKVNHRKSISFPSRGVDNYQISDVNLAHNCFLNAKPACRIL